MTTRRLKFNGWGYQDTEATDEELAWVEAQWASLLGIDAYDATPLPSLDDIDIRAPRVAIPATLAEVCSTEKYERLRHAYGRSAHDLTRMILGRDFSNPPEAVAFPKTEADISAVLDWCGDNGIRVIPFGGGSSVNGGVTPPRDDDTPVVSLDLGHFDRVLEIDDVSDAALIQAGMFGPALEAALKPAGYTMRFFPQSFECSTLGGWIATRAAGHYTMLMTQIDDYIESLRTVTPMGVMESRRIPCSGAGASPDRMMIGSEGILGVISQAWVRLRRRPVHRTTDTVRFADFHAAVDAVRALSQSDLYPANCRLIDAEEAGFMGAADGTDSILVLGFESATHPVDHWHKLALELCADHGGRIEAEAVGAADATHKSGAAGQWRNAFMRAPYYREHGIARGVMRETFESSVPWSAFKDFHANVTDAMRRAIDEITGRPGSATCRFTHVYPDGPAPYFTYHAHGDKARLGEQFWAMKTAISDALVDNGGTITHHHSVGRDHRQWYDRQRPELFADAYRSAKATLDPQGIMNPGVLLDPDEG